jgi:predicted transcriptional regulator
MAPLFVQPLECRQSAMYTYIMRRTQIYLTEREAEELDRLARATGRTRSHLIREAIETQYLAGPAIHDAVGAIRSTAGAWGGRDETGEAYVDRARWGSLARKIGGAAGDPGAPDPGDHNPGESGTP